MTERNLNELQQFYGITISERERELLMRERRELNAMEAQDAYLLAMALEPAQCPACSYKICRYSANPHFSTRASTLDDEYYCPACGVELLYHLSIIGEQWFTRRKAQTAPVNL